MDILQQSNRLLVTTSEIKGQSFTIINLNVQFSIICCSYVIYFMSIALARSFWCFFMLDV